jgi:hypothetical protein
MNTRKHGQMYKSKEKYYEVANHNHKNSHLTTDAKDLRDIINSESVYTHNINRGLQSLRF